MTEVDSLPNTAPSLPNNDIGVKDDQQELVGISDKGTIKEQVEEDRPSVETSNDDEKPKKGSPDSCLAPPPTKNPWTRNVKRPNEGKLVTFS